jgi:hypothetical protein
MENELAPCGWCCPHRRPTVMGSVGNLLNLNLVNITTDSERLVSTLLHSKSGAQLVLKPIHHSGVVRPNKGMRCPTRCPRKSVLANLAEV